jgi:hypothetical protein
MVSGVQQTGYLAHLYCISSPVKRHGGEGPSPTKGSTESVAGGQQMVGSPPLGIAWPPGCSQKRQQHLSSRGGPGHPTHSTRAVASRRIRAATQNNGAYLDQISTTVHPSGQRTPSGAVRLACVYMPRWRVTTVDTAVCQARR